jgi:hypothetical protein
MLERYPHIRMAAKPAPVDSLVLNREEPASPPYTGAKLEWRPHNRGDGHYSVKPKSFGIVVSAEGIEPSTY